MTLPGNRVAADKVSSDEVGQDGGPSSIVAAVLTERGHLDTYVGGGAFVAVRQRRVMPPEARQH